MTAHQMAPLASPALLTRRAELLNHHAQYVARFTLPEPIVRQFSEDPVLSLEHGPEGSPAPRLWLAAPAERDPLRTRDGRHYIPTGQRAELKRISLLDIPFQRVVIAHEIAVTPSMAGLLAQLADGPRRCTDDVALALAGSTPPHPGVAGATSMIDSFLRRGATLATSMVKRTRDGLDPIVFGIIGHPEPVRHGELALWYPLAAWVW